MDELLAGGDIIDQTDDLTGGPDTIVRVTGGIDLAATRASDEFSHVLKLQIGLLLALVDLNGNLVLEDTRGVAERTEDEGGLAFVGLHDGLLDVLVNGRLDGAHETRAHVDTLSAKRNGSRQAAAITEATRGNVRDGELLGRLGQQNQATNVVLTGVTGALKTVHGDDVDTETLSREGVSDGSALVEDDDTGILEHLDILASYKLGVTWEI